MFYDGNLVIEERNTNSVPISVSYTRGNDLSRQLLQERGWDWRRLLARTDRSIPRD